MFSDKVVVSSEEIAEFVSQAKTQPDTPASLPPRMRSPLPLWTRIVLSLLVPMLPLLCVFAVILRIAFRSQPPLVRYAMASFLSTLLIVSGCLMSVTAVLFVSFAPMPAIVSTGLAELDERTDFPVLSPATVLSSAEASSKLKPLVIVVSPVVKLWSRQEVAGDSFGAGMLLDSNQDGYLFATANHVASHAAVRDGGPPPHVMVSTAAGIWSTADIIAAAAPLDLALLWVPRHSGHAVFVQPISVAADGEPVFVIGHPEGLKYTLSTGLVSGLRDEAIQISAAISPGNSGGPVYDVHGGLIGIVSSKFDHNRDANAENLGFAARAEILRDLDDWTFYGAGRAKLQSYLNDLNNALQQAKPAAAPEVKPAVKTESK